MSWEANKRQIKYTTFLKESYMVLIYCFMNSTAKFSNENSRERNLGINNATLKEPFVGQLQFEDSLEATTTYRIL